MKKNETTKQIYDKGFERGYRTATLERDRYNFIKSLIESQYKNQLKTYVQEEQRINSFYAYIIGCVCGFFVLLLILMVGAA